MSVPPGRRSEAQGPPATTATGTATGVQRGGNGPSAASPVASPVAPRVRPREARQARFARSFAQVVAVLMRDPNFRTMPLADLEWLVLPAVMSGQFRVAEAPASLGPGKATDKARDKATDKARDKAPDKAKTGGVLVPVAVALWARVSGEIDKALAGSLDRPVRLKPHQWASGEHVWLVAVAGDRRAVPKLIERIASTELKGQRIKMRVKGTGNTVVVKTLGEARD
jgi:hemolysin-activating ACP:hemolysin acyltransferase